MTLAAVRATPALAGTGSTSEALGGYHKLLVELYRQLALIRDKLGYHAAEVEIRTDLAMIRRYSGG